MEKFNITELMENEGFCRNLQKIDMKKFKKDTKIIENQQ